jgi:hypothetical protein
MCRLHIGTGMAALANYLGAPKLGMFHGWWMTNLYAIKSIDHVKIGVSNCVEQRHGELQASCPVPLEIYGSIFVSEKTEGIVHKRLTTWRLHGEWFRWEGDVIEVADAIRGQSHERLAEILTSERPSVLPQFAADLMRK